MLLRYDFPENHSLTDIVHLSWNYDSFIIGWVYNIDLGFLTSHEVGLKRLQNYSYSVWLQNLP